MSDIKPYKEKEGEFFHLKIPMKDACKFFMYNDQIKERLADNKPVPLRFYNRMMGLLRPKDEDEEEYYSQTREVLTKSICEYFKNDKEYFFSITGKSKDIKEIIIPGEVDEDGYKNVIYEEDIDTSTYEEVDIDNKKKNRRTKNFKINYTFESMISNVLNTTFYHVFSDKKNTKEDILKACYLSILGYTKEDKKITDKISHYKASVISGYITMRFGQALSKELTPQSLENQKPSNGEIYNAVKHCTDLLNPIKKKKK